MKQRGKKVGLLLLALLLPMLAVSDTVPAGKRWHEPFVTLLNVEFVDTGFNARWEYFHCGCGDILVRVEQSAPDGVLSGELLLVDGQAIAGRGMVALSADLEPMLQAPSIMMHLAFVLMERALPAGPASVSERVSLELDESELPLEINSGLATGSFPAPWSLRGEAWASGDGQRRFELQFEFSNPALEGEVSTQRFNFTGGQDYRRDSFPLTGATPLEGWKLQWISKGETAASDPEPGLTLEQLRAQALALSNPEV